MDSGGPKEAFIRWGALWRYLANTIEPSICAGDAAFLSNYFDHLLPQSVELTTKTASVRTSAVTISNSKECYLLAKKSIVNGLT